MFQFHAGHGPSPWPSLFCPDLRPRYTPPVLALAPHPALHPAFESLGYASGYTLYKRSRRRHGDILPEPQRWSVIAAAALGALLGSHIRGLLEQAPRTHLHLAQILLPGRGKTIVGGLLGGWLAVELAERLQGIHARTGDLFVLPLCLRIAVGRIGCLLAGLADDTFGSPSTLPWAINFGDGVPRHPPSSTRSSSSPPSPSPSTLHRRAHLPQRHPLPPLSRGLFPLATPHQPPQTPAPLHGLNLIQWACIALTLSHTYSRLQSGLTARQTAIEGRSDLSGSYTFLRKKYGRAVPGPTHATNASPEGMLRIGLPRYSLDDGSSSCCRRLMQSKHLDQELADDRRYSRLIST